MAFQMTHQPPVKFNVRVNQYRYGYEDLLRIWQEADRLGYYSASLFDLLTVDALECWTTLTALLAQTERIRAVPMVLANPYRHPVLTAKMAATLDVISGGRITLGIGAGGSRSDTLAGGLPFPSTRVRCEMLEESVALMRRLWTEPSVDFNGQHYHLAGASVLPKPTQQPAPPVLVGGHGPRYVLPMIGRVADISNVGSNDTIEEHRQHDAIIHRAAEAAGRDPTGIELTHNADCVIAPTQREYDLLVARLAERAGMTAAAYENRAAPQRPVRHAGAGCGARRRIRGIRHPLLLHRLPRPGAVGNAGAVRRGSDRAVWRCSGLEWRGRR